MKWTINPDSPAPTGLCEYVYVNMLNKGKTEINWNKKLLAS